MGASAWDRGQEDSAGALSARPPPSQPKAGGQGEFLRYTKWVLNAFTHLIHVGTGSSSPCSADGDIESEWCGVNVSKVTQLAYPEV